ncbi:hypothetical protein B296_00059058 [Ensete ventricosum]|uniref:Uncharacterized protein n=1 Tax=Ensete ventricosum TaxID=4639 RepID=A0A426XFB3_ENSVE|nr:hypothetical protein B296_00059058 [Ensete ventricosum]
MYYPIGSHTSMVSQKNVMIIYFARSLVQSRVSIGFSCTILEIQNIGHSRCISPWEVIYGFTRRRDGHKLCVKSRAESSFDRFFVHHLEISKYWPFPTY